jgi:hypothetical protein
MVNAAHTTPPVDPDRVRPRVAGSTIGARKRRNVAGSGGSEKPADQTLNIYQERLHALPAFWAPSEP